MVGTISAGTCPLSQAFLGSEQLARLSMANLSNFHQNCLISKGIPCPSSLLFPRWL